MMILEISLAAGYLVGGGLSAAVFSPRSWEQSLGPFFASIFWPVAMPPVLTYLGVNKIKEKGLCLPTRKSKAIAYAEAPLSILAAMVAQRILTYPEGFGFDKWENKEKTIYVDLYSSGRLYYVIVDGKTFNNDTFKASDLKKLNEALISSKKLGEERKAAEAAARLNNKALDVIEKLAGIPVACEPTLLSVEK